MKNGFSVKIYADMGIGFRSDFSILPLKIVKNKISSLARDWLNREAGPASGQAHGSMLPVQGL